MRLRLLPASAIVAVLVLLSSGCSNDDNPAAAGTAIQAPQSPIRNGYIITGFGEYPTLGVTNFKGYLNTHSESGVTRAIAVFLGSKQQFVPAGNVTINGTLVDTTIASHQQGQIVHLAPKPEVGGSVQNVYFNGSMHAWSVGGNGDVQQFADGVTSPGAPPSITYPLHTSTIRRSDGLTVRWKIVTGETVSVMIDDGEGQILTTVATGDHASFTSEELFTLKPGNVYITVSFVRSKTVTINGENYLIVAQNSSYKIPALQ